MKLSRFVAALGAAVTGAVLAAAPPAAAAAPEVPGVPLGVQQVRSTANAAQTDVFWKPATYAARYRVKVTDAGSTVGNYLVPATAARTADGRYRVAVSTPNKCSTYRITVRAEDALGQGADISVTEKSLAPTIVTKARAYRGADRTRATFEMAAPQWKGYLGPTGGARADDLKKPTISVVTQLQLVRLVDGKVISTVTTTQTGWAGAKLTRTYTGLEAKRAYVLKVTTANGWGTCTRQDGKILLNAVPA
ncbi:hypothetical protein Asp14428_56540 [Actinoplanes sp. NBRC 14428]|uniref:Fibronectin type-III domain-containing protein n=1 Tax=Pseudosporangium ferrugineum TaxID=439699 RepID=A0A2T0RDR8_9ACTN|nr:hypothetical protein [Pseudosporangium ferrugineum]PRY19250.1 hypothetical protein CLV70_13613 [Pseudosporangium ferrugineum]BCJ54179.1 hypothetical protein Asp14428_56540 [Actinoplanes sp. NBRC 14428]